MGGDGHRDPRAKTGRPARSGIALVLAHDFHHVVDDYITGAIAGVKPPETQLPESFNEWHRVDLLADGDHFDASIDGKRVQSLDLPADPELRYRLRRGYIGFLEMGHAFRVRNVRIALLPDRLKYVDLWNGRDLEGWRRREESGTWSVEAGAIRGANGHGILYAPGVFQDFELTTMVRSHNRVNSGIFLRGSPDKSRFRGFEIQVYSPADALYPTGSIYGKVRSRTPVDYEGQWFLMQVIVEGAHCLVRLNGDTVAETDRLPESDLRPGRIGLQMHMENASVEFRDLRVRPLFQSDIQALSRPRASTK